MEKVSEPQEEVREDFCAACATIPLAMAGAGLGLAGAKKGQKHKMQKKILLGSAIGTIALSILIAVYFIYIKKCDDCR